ncbi:MAG: head decoration protein [Rhodocyclaceae bacterium]|nr:head decoration protein [Rhodocyclaceae bacterium]
MPTMNATEGQFIKYEAPQNYSRDDVTVASGQNLVAGQVVGRITASGKIAAFNPGASDGTQNAIGIMAANVNAAAGDAPGVIIARHAIVVGRDELVFSGSPTNAQKDAAIAALKALGIVARKTV